MDPPNEVLFDGWTLFRTSGELSRDGQTTRLPQQPLRVLLELVDNAGEVVTRERLVQVLWPKGVVDFDNSLNTVVRKLRVALGDTAETPRYIETLPRVGYRFIAARKAAPVGPGSQVQVPGRGARAWWPIVAASVIAGAGLTWWIAGDRSEPTPPASSPTPLVARRTTSVRAYELYLQGTFNRSRRDINGSKLAIENLEGALREDPLYAEAWAGLGETLLGAAIGQYQPTGPLLERAKKAALRSVELDGSLAETHTVLAMTLMFYDHDYAAAEAEFMKARACNERYGRLWHGIGSLRAYQGRFEEALADMRRARELEPMTLLFNSNYGLVLYHARRYDEAIAHVTPLLTAQPQLLQSRGLLVRALVAKGDVAAATAQLINLKDERGPNVSDAGLVHAHAGRMAEALKQIARIEALGQEGYGVGYDLAVIHAALGDLPAACAALRRGALDHSPMISWMHVDPRMDPLRKERCFADVSAAIYK
jgi:DNA-binding winged helix-turn-helix (wHTH) protein/tetratricopeptide (TPR) repeat protein